MTSTLHPADADIATGPCADCGFRPSTVPPPDTVVAVRSLPRRFAAALALADEEDELLTGRPAPGDWSALDHAGHVRDVLHAVGGRIRRTLHEDEPQLAPLPDTPPSGAAEQGKGTVLAGLSANVDELARCLEELQGDDWTRAGARGAEAVTVLDLAREAVHEGVHHLREAQRTLDRLRRSRS